MSNQSSVSTLTIGLIVVGLVIGAGGGYFFSSSSLQPKITDLESQVISTTSKISALTSDVSSLEEDNSDLENQVSILDDQVTGLESQISSLSSQISSIESDLEDAEDTISQKENAITELETTISENEDSLDEKDAAISELESSVTDYESQIENLEAQVASSEASTPGYTRYSIYDFSFEYPVGWSVSLSGLLESVATENSGMITVAPPADDSAYALTYIYSNIPIDPDVTLDGNVGAYEVNTIEARTSGTLNGHTIRHQELTVMTQGILYYMEWNGLE